MKLIEPSSAHQMFGRAGRPQFDDRGYVFALPHEDDVKIVAWPRKSYNQIPDDTKDPGLRKAQKALKKKMPKRREGVQYWNETQFQHLVAAPPASLSSRGKLPWRLLAYMLEASAEVEPIRQLVAKRLLSGKLAEQAQKQLNDQLITLWRAGYVELEPKPSLADMNSANAADAQPQAAPTIPDSAAADTPGGRAVLDLGQRREPTPATQPRLQRPNLPGPTGDPDTGGSNEKTTAEYRPQFAHPTERLSQLAILRGVHPLYGMFLMNHLGIADRSERLQAMESLLEMPRSMGRAVRVPGPDELPPGPLATSRLDEQLLKLGLATAEELGAVPPEDEEQQRSWFDEDERVFVLSLAAEIASPVSTRFSQYPRRPCMASVGGRGIVGIWG